tara:strand:+ start:325 stop:495 length:171 start_codon:yes stop_codon:yes gene_type:complete
MSSHIRIDKAPKKSATDHASDRASITTDRRTQQNFSGGLVMTRGKVSAKKNPAEAG